jgi:hypothetical protein
MEFEEFEELIAELTDGILMPRHHPFDVRAQNGKRLQVKVASKLYYPPKSISGQWGFNFNLPLKGAWDQAILGGWDDGFHLYLFDIPRAVIDSYFATRRSSTLRISPVSHWMKYCAMTYEEFGARYKSTAA